jgi:hypothetical protein
MLSRSIAKPMTRNTGLCVVATRVDNLQMLRVVSLQSTVGRQTHQRFLQMVTPGGGMGGTTVVTSCLAMGLHATLLPS